LQGASSYKVDQLRLWSVQVEGNKLQDGLNKVAASLKDNTPMRQSPTTSANDTEENSGLECPGDKSLEAYMGSLMTLEDKNFMDECILVEIADGSFAFKYTK
jgi:hypothetical protein